MSRRNVEVISCDWCGRDLAEKENDKVIFGGRLGQYKYYNMDQVIAAALESVKNEFGE